MRAMAIPRLDPGAEGIHLLWSWPDVLPLSEGGYNIQRLESKEQRREQRCETIENDVIAILRARGEYPAPLGPLRYRADVRFNPITDQSILEALAGSPGRRLASAAAGAVSGMLARSPVTASAVAAGFEEFIQELSRPTDHVLVSAEAGRAVTIALSAGKAVGVRVGTGFPLLMEIEAAAIDTVIVYVLKVNRLRICVFDLDQRTEDAAWAQAPYIVKGLTLPIHEADPSLATPAAEFAAAESRLVGAEALGQADFARMVPSMRRGVSATTLGRTGERILLVRNDLGDPYEEIPFEAQLSALAVHPKVRRILGFGFADRSGLTPGNFYQYRITGRFRAEDVTDDIYDVHLAPSATQLPRFFTIRNLGVQLQTPVKTVLDPPGPAGTRVAVSRRGIRVDTGGFDGSWLAPDFGRWSIVFDLPRAADEVVLEVAPGHSFAYAGGHPWAFGAVTADPVPPGPSARLHFPQPVTQVRLSGSGTLYALRLPSGQRGWIDLHAYASARFAAEPLPEPPPVFAIDNLQQPPTILAGTVNESTPVAPRPPLGFRLNWLPPVTGNVGYWPEDVSAGPPLDAIGYQIEHRSAAQPAAFGPWEPIHGGDNFTLGSRDLAEPQVRVEPGMDFDEVFPRIRPRGPGAGFALHLSDVFGARDPETGTVRPPQKPGTHHQYRIRSEDAVGRVGAVWTDSNIRRLEKHVAPPLPVDPQVGVSDSPSPLDGANHWGHPPGPTARVIVQGARGLTAADVALLGAHQNAIVLRWGWRQQERELDPTTREFRVYTTPPPDVVSGSVGGVTSVSPNWRLALALDRALQADECAGQWITSGGYPFRILQHDAGTAIGMTVEAAQANPSAVPAVGPVIFGRPLSARLRRPAEWSRRVFIEPLTAAGSYDHVFYDLLTLTPAHPRDAIWVGVSAADDQSYVADEVGAGPNAPRFGNESSVAACSVVARYQGQPVFSVPPPIGDVPELVTEEPTGRQVLVPLDLVSLLGGALPAGAPVAIERCSGDDVISRLRVSAGNIVLTNIDGAEQTIAFANPGDQAAVLGVLQSANPQRLPNRYLLHLVTHSAAPEAFFNRISGQIDTVATVNDRLAPKPGRYLYRVRAADAQGHVSDGGAILPLIARVPSTAGAVTPRRRAVATDNAGASLTVAVPPDPETTHLLLFAVVTAPGVAPLDRKGAELLRMPNRRDLYPANGIRLGLSDGTLVAPAAVMSLADPGVTTEPDGTRMATLTVGAAPKSWVVLWCFALTRDGFASYVCGPFGTGTGS